jgi:hypothetical protein
LTGVRKISHAGPTTGEARIRLLTASLPQHGA